MNLWFEFSRIEALSVKVRLDDRNIHAKEFQHPNGHISFQIAVPSTDIDLWYVCHIYNL